MKQLYILFTFIFISGIAIAQDPAPADTSYWKKGGAGTLTFSNVTLSNWAAGGENSVSLNGFLGLFANYKKARTTWDNSLNLGYGLLKQGEGDFVKSDDKINFATKYGYQLNNETSKWYFSALLDFKSQFAEGVDEADSVISRFMAPGYLIVATGIDYKVGDVFSANLAPVTGKFTFVTDQALADAGAYGVDPGSNARAELGAFLRMQFKKDIVKNVNYETRLELFTNYIENFGDIDVNWENILVMKVNKFLSANLITQLIYDKDIDIEVDNNDDGIIDEVGPKVQFKTVFGVGLSYKFGDQ
ncbi:MAG: DUF3078 domain-containing protein [bacterium]|nr:DUF3078 domain-containing protein [bacterium]